MNRRIFIGLIIFFISVNNVKSQQKTVTFKQIKNSYKRIIHFSPNDYVIRTEGSGSGIKGIYAGDNYLIVWDIDNFYVFDINSYNKLATVTPEFSIKDIIEIGGKIYCLSGDNIYEYSNFAEYTKYRLESVFRNLADLKRDRELLSKRYKGKDDEIPPGFMSIEQVRQLRSQIPRWSKKQIISIHNFHGTIYLNINNNYLNMRQDLIMDLDDKQYYLFLKKPPCEAERWWLIDDNFFRVRHTKNNIKRLFSFDVLKKDFYSQEIDTTSFIIDPTQTTGNFVSWIPFAFVNNWIYLNCSWDYLDDNQYFGKSIIGLNLKTKEAVNIDLPDGVQNLGFVTTSLKYFTFTASFLFILVYNKDLSCDVLKVEAK